jgi:hypothetical protein
VDEVPIKWSTVVDQIRDKVEEIDLSLTFSNKYYI